MARLGFASGFCEVLGAKRAGFPEPIFLSLKEKWRGWDLRAVFAKSWERSEQESQNQFF